MNKILWILWGFCGVEDCKFCHLYYYFYLKYRPHKLFWDNSFLKPLLQPAIQAATGGLRVKYTQNCVDHAGATHVFFNGRWQAADVARGKLACTFFAAASQRSSRRNLPIARTHG